MYFFNTQEPEIIFVDYIIATNTIYDKYNSSTNIARLKNKMA